MATVYALSSGSYSDYSVSCVFANKADAETAADALNGAEGYHEDFAVEKFDFHEGPAEVGPYWTWSFAERYGPDEPQERARTALLPSSRRPTVTEIRNSPTTYQLHVGGKDREAVRKAFFDRYEAWRATVALTTAERP
jgi:hypothetical protein